MVIDFHLHLAPRENMSRSLSAYCDGFGGGMDWSRVLDGPESLDAFLESEGVDLAVGLSEMNPGVAGVAPNAFTLERYAACRRLILFASLNPATDGDLGAEVRRLDGLGFRGVKLYPTYQDFHPAGRELYPMYEACAERGWPVMVHTGLSVFRGARLRYADPLLLDDVAVDFPDIPLLLCHGGRGVWYDRAALLARLHPNVYIEISGLPPRKLGEYFPGLERLWPRMVFGSDWPGTPGIGKTVEEIRRLPLPPGAAEAILGGTAAGILRLGKGS